MFGHTLARAHARSSGAVATSTYPGTSGDFEKAVREFTESFADQSEQEYTAFTDAISDGRLAAHEDLGGAEGVSAARKAPAMPPSARRAGTDTHPAT